MSRYSKPAKLIGALRSALDESGAKGATGWIIAFLHGEWDPVGMVFRLHMHGFAYGQMVEAIDALRKMPNYQTRFTMPDGTRSPVYRRIRMTRQGLENLPSPITYALQSFWPARALIMTPDGKRLRVRQKGRIREPYGTKALMWLDQWRLSDLTLMVGLRVTKQGLKQTRVVS